jgi:hypothetical protein
MVPPRLPPPLVIVLPADAFVVRGFTPSPDAFLLILNILARALLIFARPAGA